jgi:hypothetical protein
MNSKMELEERSVRHQSWTDTNNSDCAGSPTERNVVWCCIKSRPWSYVTASSIRIYETIIVTASFEHQFVVLSTRVFGWMEISRESIDFKSR